MPQDLDALESSTLVLSQNKHDENDTGKAGQGKAVKNSTSAYRKPRSGKLGPVARILVSANRWLRGIKTYRFPWYFTPVSDNHASNNPGLDAKVNPFWSLLLDTSRFRMA